MVKPRFDGGGSEFGLIHRSLPANCCMFDLDYVTHQTVIDTAFCGQDMHFIEYRVDDAGCRFAAYFEIKAHPTEHVMRPVIENHVRIGTPLWAQISMCEQLNCRFFYVVATDGGQPFDFYEYDWLTGVGFDDTPKILEYADNPLDKAKSINQFWAEEINLVTFQKGAFADD